MAWQAPYFHACLSAVAYAAASSYILPVPDTKAAWSPGPRCGLRDGGWNQCRNSYCRGRGRRLPFKPTCCAVGIPRPSCRYSAMSKPCGPKKAPAEHGTWCFSARIIDSILVATFSTRGIERSLLSFYPAPFAIDHRVAVGITFKAGSLTKTSCYCRPEKSVEYPHVQTPLEFHGKHDLPRTMPERHVPVWGPPVKVGAASRFILIVCASGKGLDGLQP